jgi:hypothetical protein
LSEGRKDYVAGRQCALGKLRVVFQLRPQFLDGHLRSVVALAQSRLDDARARAGKAAIVNLRACVLEPFGGQSLRVSRGYGMDGDADDRLPVDRRARGAGEAFSRADVVVMTFSGAPPFMTKYERALIRPGLRSALCIPIFRDVESWEQPPAARPQPLGVLSVDSDDDLSAEFADTDFLRTLVEKSVLLSPAFEME